MVRHAAAAPLPATVGSVQLLNVQHGGPEELQHAEPGILISGSPLPERDSEQQAVLDAMVDEVLLREAYNVWYTGRGRREEQRMAQEFQKYAQAHAPALLKYHAARFRDTVWSALKLEEDDEDKSLLNACRAAIANSGYDAASYICLQRAIGGGSAQVHPRITRREVEKAAERQLQHTGFVSVVVQALAE